MLTMLLTSCVTLVVNAPKVNFPVPPEPLDFEKDKENQVMLIPFWYWENLGEFYIEYDAALDRYEYYLHEDKK